MVADGCVRFSICCTTADACPPTYAFPVAMRRHATNIFREVGNPYNDLARHALPAPVVLFKTVS